MELYIQTSFEVFTVWKIAILSVVFFSIIPCGGLGLSGLRGGSGLFGLGGGWQAANKNASVSTE